MVLGLVDEGIENESAISRASNVLQLPYLHVEANYEDQKRENKRRLREDRNTEIAKLYRSGFSVKEISKKINVSTTTVRKVIDQ